MFDNGIESLNNTDIDPQRAIEHVRKNRQKAKDFADRIKQGYIPEKRLKDEIVEHVYDSMTGSHDKPSYDDLLELRNYLLSNGKTSVQTQDGYDSETDSDDNSKPVKPEVHIEGQSLKNSKSANNDAEEIKEVEGKDYYVYDIKKPLGIVSFNNDRTCTDPNGNIIGMWNEEGRIRDPDGKQIGHLPSSETKRFNEFLDAIGIKHNKGFGVWFGDLKIL
jgi:hypothetical protein